MKKRLGIVLAAMIFVIPGWAKAADVDLPVPIQEYNNIRYYSMGVSVDERRTLPQLYPLKLIFATNQGHMLCDADVTVNAGGKTVFRGRAENGPWLIYRSAARRLRHRGLSGRQGADRKRRGDYGGEEADDHPEVEDHGSGNGVEG